MQNKNAKHISDARDHWASHGAKCTYNNVMKERDTLVPRTSDKTCLNIIISIMSINSCTRRIIILIIRIIISIIIMIINIIITTIEVK